MDQDPKPDTAAMARMIEETNLLWQMPLLGMAGLWSTLLEPWLPHTHDDAGAPVHDLVVPDCIEEEGEHALFA